MDGTNESLVFKTPLILVREKLEKMILIFGDYAERVFQTIVAPVLCNLAFVRTLAYSNSLALVVVGVLPGFLRVQTLVVPHVWKMRNKCFHRSHSLIHIAAIVMTLPGMTTKWVHFHHVNPSMPRAAIMGGAIVAVLMSWRDPKVMKMEEWEELEQWFSNEKKRTTATKTETKTTKKTKCNSASQEEDPYEALIERLQKQLQDYFYGASSSSFYRGDRMLKEYLKKRSAAYVAGDVDIFLQPSPLTRSLTSHLAQHGVEQDLLNRVAEYIGGFQFCEGDLKGMSTELCENLIAPEFYDIGPLIYSATQRGVSFALVDGDSKRHLDDLRWPRNTQLIMLSERADLLGALFDFDISVAALAYDGIHVRAAPRAVLSLLTNVLVVTPFILAEKRNRQRIFKVQFPLC